MEIKQKKFSTKHIFTFEDDYLNFAFKDKSGSDDIDLNYADFPDKSSISIEQNEWLRNVGILWCLLGSYSIGNAIYSDLSLSGTGFWLFIGILSLVWYMLTKIKYSVYKTDRGHVFIMHDSNKDKIFNEINIRKKAQLLNWYGNINLDNGLENEVKKFNWLVKEKVITQLEADEKIAQIEFACKEHSVEKNQLN